MRYLMTFSYDGSKYSGYQIQPNRRTVQGEIEKSLTKINSNKYITIYATGRTDAGVHAVNQKAHFDLDKEISCNILRNSLNKMIANDIYIKDVIQVNEDFHARFDVLKKKYVYKINIGEYNPIEKDYLYQYNQQLNVDKMRLGANYLIGEHDFTSFTKKNEDKESFVRTIYEIKIEQNDNIITITLIGNGFLRYMVRNIVGTLIEVGNNKRDFSEIKNILEAKDRNKAGVTAPACGLYLKNVYYMN